MNMASPAEPAQSRRSPIVHEGHTSYVTSVSFSPDGKSVASGSWDNTIRIWDADSTFPIGEPLTGHSDMIGSISYSPLGNVIASGSEDKTIRIWDVHSRRQLGEPMKGDHPFDTVAFSPDAKLIASDYGFTVQLWDVPRRKPASNPLEGHTRQVNSVQFSPDGTRVVSGSWDKTIRVWDVERGTTIVGPLKGHTHWVNSVAFSPDYSQIVSGSYDRTLRLWDPRSGGTIGNPYEGHTSGVWSVAFSPRGTYVTSGGEEMNRVWDVRTGRQVDPPFQEHTRAVYSVAFSPCGQYVASGSGDKKVIIRSTFATYPEPLCDLELVATPEDGGDFLHDETTHMVVGPMSTQQMFDCLIRAGCIDLSSQMDTNQDTAMIMSGGGFSDIWMGLLHNGSKVAIKTWRTNELEHCDHKTLKRAGRELLCWSRMKHRNIHQLMGVIIFKDNYLGMVSEWMDNGNLRKYLRKNPGADRYQLCIDIASGLEYMHDQGTVHGDLKAFNVLVSLEGVARISDFDFSVMSSASGLMYSASSNSCSGSIRWVAPEMLAEEAPKRTEQSDVYALGMTMLEVFTGDFPYPECQKDFAIMKKVEKGILPPRPTVLLDSDQRGDLLWQLLLNCWSRNLDERPSAGRIREALFFYAAI